MEVRINDTPIVAAISRKRRFERLSILSPFRRVWLCGRSLIATRSAAMPLKRLATAVRKLPTLLKNSETSMLSLTTLHWPTKKPSNALPVRRSLLLAVACTGGFSHGRHQRTVRAASRFGLFPVDRLDVVGFWLVVSPWRGRRAGHFRNSAKNASSSSKTVFGFRPSWSFSNISTSLSPSTSSIGRAPSRLASRFAS